MWSTLYLELHAEAACCSLEAMSLQENGRDVSPWHDIPLKNSDGTLNFVCGEAGSLVLLALHHNILNSSCCSKLSICGALCAVRAMSLHPWVPLQQTWPGLYEVAPA